jgi:predicted SAM-dependent methyltransferase
MDKLEKLHLGCGLNTPGGWLNVDGSWNARFAKHPFLKKILGFFKLVPESVLSVPWSREIFLHNLRKPLPFSDNSFSAVYASHLLEHFYLNEAQNLLKECHRVLKPGGILRIMVPDLEERIKNYSASKKSYGESKVKAGDAFMESINVHPRNFRSRGLVYRLYDNATSFHNHKWMYDADSLVFYMKEAGFFDAGRRGLFDSEMEDIKKIELNTGLCAEGTKQ